MTNKEGKFKFGWAAAFHDYLFKRTLSYEKTKTFLKMLNPSIYEWWKHEEKKMTEPVQNIINAGNWWSFADMTSHYTRANNLWFNKGKCFTGKNLQKFLNDTGLPKIRCPAGCCIHIDSPDKMSILSIKHYMASFIDDFKSYDGANKDYFKCKRLDWDEVIKNCGVSYQPAFVISEEHGYCVLTCNAKEHAMNRNYIHAPPSAVLEQATMVPIKEAPMHLTANTVNSGRKHEFNTSFDTATMTGTRSGLSTVNIALDPITCVGTHGETPDMREMQGVMCHERTDCLNIVKQNYDKDYCKFSEDYKNVYDNLSQEKKNKIKRSKTIGSYIDFEDKCQRVMACFKIISEHEKGGRISQNNLLDCLSFVRNSYIAEDGIKRSHPAIIFSMKFENKHQYSSLFLLSILANNRKIHRDYVQERWKKGNIESTEIDIYKGIRDMLSRAVTGMKAKNQGKYISAITQGLLDFDIAVENNEMDIDELIEGM